MYTIRDNKHRKELTELDFSENLLCTPEDCELWLNHCKEYNMKFLKGSYGTLVNKDFNKFFKKSNNRKMKDLLTEDCIDSLLDHTNLFKSKDVEDTYILTSSPYMVLRSNVFKMLEEYSYNVYVIHPLFLDYYVFPRRSIVNKCSIVRHPLLDVNYMFTNAFQEDILEINKSIDSITGLGYPFWGVKIND